MRRARPRRATPSSSAVPRMRWGGSYRTPPASSAPSRAGSTRPSAATSSAASLAPPLHLHVDVARLRDHRWTALQLAPCLDDAAVELLDQLAHHRLRRLTVELGVEGRVVLAQLQRRGQHPGDLLALDQLLQPPVAIVRRSQVPERLAGAGQVVELAALHRLLDLQVHPLPLVLDPRSRSIGPGAGVALAAGPRRGLPGTFLALTHAA